MPTIHATGAAYIYALIDPRNGLPRYVGKSDDPERRYRGHLRDVRERKPYYKARWLACLAREGLSPGLLYLERCRGDEWQASERRWIAALREQGYPLTNITAGGDGAEGFRFSEAAKKRMSEYAKAVGRRPPPPTPERIAAAAEAARRSGPCPVRRAKISAARMGMTFGGDHRRHLSEAKKRYFNDPAAREKLSRRWGVLTDDQVREVRRLANAREISQAKIAERFGIPQSSVSEIRSGKRYAHVAG